MIVTVKTIMDQRELQQLVQQLSIEAFGKPFRHTACFNARLRTTGGRYKLLDGSIEINPTVLELYDMEELIGIIKHELMPLSSSPRRKRISTRRRGLQKAIERNRLAKILQAFRERKQ